MSKIILFSDEALTKLQSGVNTLADAVKTTLGPAGKAVIIGKSFGSPHITKDGHTVAKDIELSDPIEHIGAQLVKEVASKTNDDAGDGTTTATVLAQAMLKIGIKNITAGTNPQELTLGMNKAIDSVKNNLQSQSKSIASSKEAIKNIATISANNDQTIGDMIASAMEKVGNKGVITVEEAKGTHTETTVVKGMQFSRGYYSPHFITDHKKMTVDFDNPCILITDQKITNFQSIVKIVENVVKTGKSLLIIAEEIDNEPLAGLVINKIRAGLKVCMVKTPYFGDQKEACLRDIAVLTGGVVISEKQGYKLENTTLDQLGHAKKIKVDKENTTIIDGLGKKEKIQDRVREIELQINKKTTSDYDREKLQDRLAKFTKGVAVLHVGAVTEVEMKEKKDRVTDALNATRSAVEEGVLAGGGVALLRAAQGLEALKTENEDQRVGIKIIKKALEAPLYTILENALGGDRIYPIIHKIKGGKNDYGYNVRTHTYGSLHSLGVIDPTKVTRLALENAASIVCLLLKTDCVIADKPQKEKDSSMAGVGNRGGMPPMM